MAKPTTYAVLYGIKNTQTGEFVLTYWASSQKHKALFKTKKNALEALKWLGSDFEIIEIK